MAGGLRLQVVSFWSKEEESDGKLHDKKDNRTRERAMPMHCWGGKPTQRLSPTTHLGSCDRLNLYGGEHWRAEDDKLVRLPFFFRGVRTGDSILPSILCVLNLVDPRHAIVHSVTVACKNDHHRGKSEDQVPSRNDDASHWKK